MPSSTRARMPRFDVYRVAASQTLRALVGELIAAALATEQSLGLRTRKRRPTDALVFDGIVEAVVSDLTYHHLTGHPAVRITRSCRNLARGGRYGDRLLSEQLPAVLDLLQHMGVINQTLGSHSAMHAIQTEIAPARWLVNRIATARLSIYDTTRRGGEEIVLLKGTKDRESGAAAYIDYPETDHSRYLRQQMRTINTHLRKADVTFHNSPDSPPIDERDRYLTRKFTRGSFESGGRVWGGFWQNLPKSDRLERTLINGESVVSLDFKGMVASLAYARLGMPAPADSYTLPKVHVGDGDSRTLKRETVKRLFSAFLSYDKKLKQWPEDVSAPGIPLGLARAAIETAHPALVPMFYTGIGHSLQFDESTILIDVLLQLAARGITALPIHDCVIVAESDHAAALEIMRDTFEGHTGQPASVTVEPA